MLVVHTYFLSGLLTLSVSLMWLDLDLQQLLLQGIIVFENRNLAYHVNIGYCMLLSAQRKGIISGIQTFKGEVIFLIGCIVLFIKIRFCSVYRVGVWRAEFILCLGLLLLIIGTYHSVDIGRLILNTGLLLQVLMLFFEISECSVSVIEPICSRTAIDLLNLTDRSVANWLLIDVVPRLLPVQRRIL